MENYFSIIIPVYNRPYEVDELLNSLALQTLKNFEIVIVEDGSKFDCKSVLNKYNGILNIEYFYKNNTGPGDSRNFGMSKAKGNYFIFFDSDCIIPNYYFENLEQYLQTTNLDAFGGADNAHESFSNVQKAINFAMTAFITTGGIRGNKKSLDTFQPRSFNMGIRKKVYKTVGGFSNIHPGEDPDLSYRIMNAGFKVGFVPNAFVFHKRRVNFNKFINQVFNFGLVRNVLIKWYPKRFQIVYLFPLFFLFGCLALLILSFKNGLWLLPIFLFSFFAFAESLLKNKNLKVALLSIVASFLQLFAYAFGFLHSFINIHLLKKDERKVYEQYFFKQ